MLKLISECLNWLFGISFGSKDSIKAMNFVNAQIDADADESVYPYAREQDKLAFPRVLFKARKGYQKDINWI